MRPKSVTASITVKLRTNQVSRSGAYPVVIRIAKDNKAAIRHVGFDCFEDEWDYATQRPNKKHPKCLLLKTTIDEIVGRIEDQELEYRRKNQTYTVDDLANLVSKEISNLNVFECFDKIIKQLNDDVQVGTADTYKTTKQAIFRFYGNKNLVFSEINFNFLNGMLSFCRRNKNKPTTMFFYFKTLRAFINRCIKLGYCEPGDYGFKNFSLKQFSLTTRKRAISLESIKKIEEVTLDPYSAQWNARNYFLFSFYTRGTNLIDIAKLRKQNIIDGRLEFTRTKTGDFLSVKLNDKAIKIIQHYTNLGLRDLLFPIFDETQSQINDNTYPSRKQKSRIKSLTSSLSKNLKDVAKKCGIDCNLTFYVGRHSYANGLRTKGAGTLAIRQAMSHKDEKTTEIYLNELGNDKLDGYDDLLYSSI